MYVHLNHIKEVAEAYRAEQLRNNLAVRLQKLKLDSSYRPYREEILKSLDLPLDVLLSIDRKVHDVECQLTEMNAPPLDRKDLKIPKQVFEARDKAMHEITKGLQEMVYVIKTRPPIKHGMKLEDRARQYITGIDFNAEEIVKFVREDAENYRDARRAELTLVSFKNYHEMLKIENEIAAKYNSGIDFFRALYDASARDESGKHGSKRIDACDRSISISRAINILRSRIEHTNTQKDKLNDVLKDYEARMRKPKPLLLPNKP